VDKLRSAFENTTKAIDAMDKFRSQAIDTMGKNNAMLRELIDAADKEIVERRGARASVAKLTAESDVPL
jgi:hypothetical protein